MKKAHSYIEAFGRRKESTARVRLYGLKKEETLTIGDIKLKKGEILVNFKKIEDYFPGDISKTYYLAPLKTLNITNQYAILIKVGGGGKSGQLGAVVLGLARALEKVNKEKNRPLLKKRKLLTRDDRVKERRKAGLAQKARAKKQSPKR